MYRIDDLFGKKQHSTHDREVERIADGFHQRGISVRADHISEYPDPQMVNGRVPDVVATDRFGRQHAVEVDSNDRLTGHDRRQWNDLQEADRRDASFDIVRSTPNDPFEFNDPFDNDDSWF